MHSFPFIHEYVNITRLVIFYIFLNVKAYSSLQTFVLSVNVFFVSATELQCCPKNY